MTHPVFRADFKWVVNGLSCARPTTLTLMEECHLSRWDRAMRVARGAHWGKALEALQILRRRGLRNSLSIHNSVMHSCAIKQHWKLDWSSDSCDNDTVTPRCVCSKHLQNWPLIKHDEAYILCACHKSPIFMHIYSESWFGSIHSTHHWKSLNIWFNIFNTPFNKHSTYEKQPKRLMQKPLLERSYVEKCCRNHGKRYSELRKAITWFDGEVESCCCFFATIWDYIM